MKKFSKIASALLISFQTFTATTMNVFADEQSNDQATEQVQAADKEQTEPTESSTVASSESSTQTTESSTTPSSESSSSSTETKPSEPTTESSSEQPKKPEQPEQPEQPKPAPEEPKNEPAVPAPQQAAPAAPAVENIQSAPQQVEATTENPQSVQDGAIQFEKSETVESFILKLGEPARKIGKEKDLYASVMIAQAILESASGSSSLAKAPNYNLFGIKGTHNGKSVSMATQEDLGNGNLYTTQAGFRVYENYEDCFNDYAKLMTEGISGNSDFYAGALKSNAKSYQEATKFLTGRYATDTQYNQKLNGLIETYDLTQYDKELQGAPISNGSYKVPLTNYTISSPFGNRGGEFHRGLDMAAAQGEPIYATRAGKVLTAEFDYSWGNYVVIQHEDGTTALYAHQQQYLVKAGDNVSQGQVIGQVGSTGNSTGAHLHVELCLDSSLSQDKLVDPQLLLFGN
ncbi:MULTISPECIES: glucosaminidase domain-containing protein [Enterococcus]|uniref:glucosaminidase domain-containing protein n=1 Tax=Enterococcus TaxID=1350 RepID=UPI0008A604F5|nr:MULTISPECIES: glucosaminidase domain-containing protein [Enterococcus]MDB1729483.1 peptidoglycan DD-metalloendopeptidase family protein [Enterococcus avium]MDB1733559.1 peptidoglycan DD-metalloendopeptidase family protein [Enterococcus avium]OFL82137.1 N-acetylmuramoyl-L-alanine amidase [Enterococcus sp. HMSC072H05]